MILLRTACCGEHRYEVKKPGNLVLPVLLVFLVSPWNEFMFHITTDNEMRQQG